WVLGAVLPKRLGGVPNYAGPLRLGQPADGITPRCPGLARLFCFGRLGDCGNRGKFREKTLEHDRVSNLSPGQHLRAGRCRCYQHDRPRATSCGSYSAASRRSLARVNSSCPSPSSTRTTEPSEISPERILSAS